MGKKYTDEEVTTEAEVIAAPVSVQKPVTVIAPKLQATAAATREKVFSFEQWAKLRNRPIRHLGGMRAFLGEKAKNKYSLVKWDDLFKAY